VGTWYATIEALRGALGSSAARDDAKLARALDAGARNIDGLLRCHDIAPTVATRSFPWPNSQREPYTLWLDGNRLISVDTLVTGGVTIDADDYLLEPHQYGPPYTSIEMDQGAGSAVFGGGSTHQRDATVTGLWGLGNDEAAAGALEAAIADATTTTVDVTDASVVGVGNVLRCESERMIVTGRQALDTTQNTTGALTDSAADVTVGVATGSAYHVGERILVNAEWMLVTEIAGNNLIVKRAADGSVLASHLTAQDVYASRRLTVTRGALGTTAAAHADATALVTWAPPGLVTELQVAEALVIADQEGAAYARTTGAGDAERQATAAGINDLRRSAVRAYGRKARHRSV
jgi:hypothetical protein